MINVIQFMYTYNKLKKVKSSNYIYHKSVLLLYINFFGINYKKFIQLFLDTFNMYLSHKRYLMVKSSKGMLFSKIYLHIWTLKH